VSQAKTYDVTVIGAGPGGYVAAIRAAQLGLQVALVEKEPGGKLGGTCLIRGCIPTKQMLEAAHVLEKIRDAKKFGIVAPDPQVDWKGVLGGKNRVVTTLTKGVAFLMKKNGVEVHAGRGRLAGPGKVEVEAEDGEKAVLATKNVILATGSVPRLLPFLEVDGERIVTSDELLDFPRVPESMIVIGAGAVGVEFASIFQRFGSKVEIVEMLPHLVPIEDEEVSKELEKSFRKRRIGYHLSTRVESVKTGKKGVTLKARDGEGQDLTLEAEVLLVAVGRKPCSEDLGLEGTGVELDGGYIKTDDHMRTGEPGVFAIGDVVPTPWLAHVASAEGIVAAETIAGHETRPLDYDQVPGCTYCDPEIGSIGLSEAEAKKRGYEVTVGKFPFAPLGKARIMQESEGFVKIVAEKQYDQVLGVHIIGPKATELIAEAGIALKVECTVEEMIRTIHAHPTLSEAVAEAAHAAHGSAIHM
jgi:dihydrolipoamide dehydrogenase